MKKYYILFLFFINLVGYAQQVGELIDGSRDIKITNPAVISITNKDSKNISNLASPNGTISFKINGGIIPYDVIWKKDNSGFTPNPADISISTDGVVFLSNLNVGTYTATIKDATCPNPKTETFTIYKFLKVDFTQTNIKCFGANDGAIDLSISDGSGANTLKWDTGESTPNRIGLVPGIHTYIITDDKASGTIDEAKANGMIVEGIITILEPKKSLEVTLTNKHQPSSPGNNDGVLSLDVTGGYDNYTYAWKKDNAIIASPFISAIGNITSLSEGIYQVSVTDKGVDTGIGCTITSDPIILKALTAKINITKTIKCIGDSGTLEAVAEGGTKNYTYSWYKDNIEIIGANSSTLTGVDVTKGNYKVEVSDGDHTVNDTEDLLESTNPPIVINTSNITPVKCNNDHDGAIEITVTGGTGGYSYAWNNSETTKDISGLVAGSYSLTVTDENTCTKTLSEIVITKPLSITFPAEVITPVSIYGQSTGAITFSLDPTGGNGNYTYSWTSSTDTAFSTKTTKDIDNLKAGLYTLKVTDSNSCSATKTFEIEQPDELLVTLDETKKIACFGNQNGEITALVSGGSLNYSYKWYKDGISIPETTNILKNIGIGLYNITVTDSNGAVKTAVAFDLKPPTKLSVSQTTAPTNVLCFGNETGAIEITISGGTAPYTQQWTKNNADYSTEKDLIHLGIGEYNVTITDAVGHNCKASLPKSIIISQPTATLQINDLEVKDLTGFKTKNGSIKVEITGGTSPYNYNFDNLSNVSIPDSTLLLDKLPIGNYSLTITDANGCTVTKDYTLLQPEELKINTVTQTAVITCNGDKTAILEATVTGGRPIGTLDSDKKYIYNWYSTTSLTNTVSTSNPATGLGAGTYRLIVSDGTDSFKNTATSGDVTIIDPDPIALTYTKTDASCKGESDGTIQINVTGGSGNYNLVWSYMPSANKDKTNIINLSAGNYTVKVVDKNDINCFKEYSITIDEPQNTLTFNPENIINASGFGLSNGSITLNITGGKPPYTYKWFKGNTADSNNGIQNTSNTLGLLNAGFYTVQVEDTNPNGNNCTIIKSFEIKQPEKLTVSVAPTIAYCNNGKGSLQATANGGSEIEESQSDRIYSYTLFDANDNPLQTLFGNKVNFTALASGNYKVVATDSKNNKTVPFLVTLDQPSPIEVTLTNKEKVTCFKGNDGSISINVKGGTPNIVNNNPVYSYEWKKDGIVINVNDNLSPTLLKSGTYSVKVFDGNYNSNDPNFCIGTLDNIIITQPADFGFDLDKIVPTIPTAKSAFDGALHIEIIGGVAPYTYVCTDSKNKVIETKATIQNKQVDFLSLTTDNYTIAVTDATGCTKSTAFDFNNNVLTITTTQSVQITCNNGTNASLNALVIGGFGVKAISWYKNNTIIPNETSATLSNLGIGTYYAVIKDFNKVEVTSNSIIVTQPNAIIVTTTQKEISCSGFNDGVINLSATGGNNTFQYRFRSSGSAYTNWIPFENSTTATISNLKATTYNIQIQDSKGCSYTSNLDIILSEPAQLKITKSTITATTGFKVANGIIALTIQGGNGGYLYKWFDSTNTQLNQTTATLTNVLAGKYYAIITDSKGCQMTSPSLEVTQPDELFVNISLFNSVLCNGDKNASLKTTTTGGIVGYTYQWFNINSSNSIGTGASLSSIGAGTYFVIVTDSKNNSTKSPSFIVSEPAVLNNALSSEYTRCGDAKDWTIKATPSGGTAPYIYLWNTGVQTASLQDVVPANYSVLLTDNHGCFITKTITITAPIHLATAEVITKPTCFQGSDATIVLTSSGGQGPYSYLWDTDEKSNILSNASAKDYTVAVTDSKGCVINKAYTIENPPKDVISLGEDVTLCFDQSLTINSTIADDRAKYSWTSTKGFTSNKPIITVSEPAEYTLLVTNSLGCNATDMIKILSQSTAISAEFAVSSQVFTNEKFIIVDISNPIADSIEWVLPSEATVVSKDKDYAELSFNKKGEYELILNTKKGNCTASQTKSIVVIDGEYVNPDSTDLKKKFDLKIYPNPSSGIFTVDVTLDKVMPAYVKVYSLTNNVIIDSKYENGKDAYKFNFNLSGLTAGVYFILVESQQGNQLRKIIIN